MLLWVEGFDAFGTTDNAAPSPTGVVGRKYQTVSTESGMRVVPNRLLGKALKLSNTNQYLQRTLATTNAKLTTGIAIAFAAFPGAVREIITLWDGATKGVNLVMQTSGELSVRLGTAAAFGTTSGLALGTGFNYIELEVVCADGTGGSVELRVNGVEVLKVTGIDTRAGAHDYHDGIRLTGDSSMIVTLDDWYVVDGSGSVNNTFLGNKRVATIFPNAAGDSAQFTPSAGANYAAVDESVCDDDDSYVQDSTAGHVDLYNYEALPAGFTGISGLMVTTDVRVTDATSFSLKTPCKSGSTTSEGDSQSAGGTSYGSKVRVIEQNPATNAAWTESGINAAQFGIQTV